MDDEWKLVTPEMMTLRKYPCGLSARDVLELKSELIYRDSQNNPTGEIRLAREQATVLTGNPDEPNVIWIRWKTGENETWDDDILSSFTRIGHLDENNKLIVEDE